MNPILIAGALYLSAPFLLLGYAYLLARREERRLAPLREAYEAEEQRRVAELRRDLAEFQRTGEMA